MKLPWVALAVVLLALILVASAFGFQQHLSGGTVSPTPVPTATSTAPSLLPSPSPTPERIVNAVEATSFTLPCFMVVSAPGWIVQGAYWKAQWSPDGSQILFDAGTTVYAVDSEGRRDTPRTVADASWEVVIDGEFRTGRSASISFDVSPDGTVAFSRCADRKDGYQFLDGDRKENIVLSHVSFSGSEFYAGIEIVAARRHQFEIAVVNLDGTDAKGLIERPAPPIDWYWSDEGYRWPAWSPDGSRVAYLGDWVSNKYKATLYSAAADGTDERPLVSDRHLLGDWKSLARFPPVWSPDGRHLAVLEEGLEEVYTVRSDGSDLTLIVTEALSAPTWLPDGRIGVAVSDGEGGAVIRTFAPDGSGPVTIGSIMSDGDLAREEGSYPRYFLVQNLSWSPDGSKIMYTCELEIGPAICVADAADASVSWIAATELVEGVVDGPLVGSELNPHAVAAWSPDGSKIAIVDETEEGHLSLWTITSDGRSGQTIVGDWCVPKRSCYYRDWGN